MTTSVKAATFPIPIVAIISDDASPAILHFYEHIMNCANKRTRGRGPSFHRLDVRVGELDAEDGRGGVVVVLVVDEAAAHVDVPDE